MYIPDSSASGKSAKEIVEQYYGSNVWVVSAGDEKASGGQAEVISMFDADGASYSYSEWSAKSDDQETFVKQMLEEGNAANMICFEKGTTLSDGMDGSEHMTSFNYAYKLTAVRDWLYEQ